MANYYYVEIKSEKIDSKAAVEIFNHIMRHQRVRWFDFSEGGIIKYNSRGLEDISEILEKYGITEEEVKVEDEFERFYKNIDKVVPPNMTLEQFFYITNIENTYIFASMEEKEGSCRLKLVDSPQIGFNNYDYENLKHLRVKEIGFVDNIINIEIEK